MFAEGSLPVEKPPLMNPIVGARALVLEDEFLIAIDVQRILEAAGAREVVLAARVAEALKALDRPEPFDVAVLDLLLGDESSEPVANRLIERRIPFIYTTGADPSRDHPRAVGTMPTVPKPYASAALLAGLAEAIAITRPASTPE